MIEYLELIEYHLQDEAVHQKILKDSIRKKIS